MKKTIKEIVEYINGVSKDSEIYILGHIGPDGDCIGSSIGLSHAMINLGYNNVKVVLEKEVEKYSYLYNENVINEYNDEEPDLTIMVDIRDPERLMNLSDFVKKSKCKIIIDHHEGTTDHADLQYINPKLSSCAEIVFEVIKELGATITKEIAECLYTGIMTDTGLLKYEYANKKTYEVAGELVEVGINKRRILDNAFFENTLAETKILQIALSNLVVDGKFCYTTILEADINKAGVTDTEMDIVKIYLQNIKECEVIGVFREYREGTKVSLRSKCEVDVDGIATIFAGGGHKKAAGITRLDMNIDDMKEQMIKIINEKMINRV